MILYDIMLAEVIFMKSTIDYFWNATQEDLKKGYVDDNENERYVCLICGRSYQKGYIYKVNDELMDAMTKMKHHIEFVHGGIFQFLLSMDKKYTGLSDVQITLLKEFYQGEDDLTISHALNVTKSNVRNHRFRLKEKAKQAKIFLTLYEMVEAKTDISQKMIDFHHTAKQVDERYAITEIERKKCIEKLFDEQGQLQRFPTKEKEKLIVLLKIVNELQTDLTYTEKELNHKLKEIYPDFPLIRRYLIEYGFMERKADGSSYWVKT